MQWVCSTFYLLLSPKFLKIIPGDWWMDGSGGSGTGGNRMGKENAQVTPNPRSVRTGIKPWTSILGEYIFTCIYKLVVFLSELWNACSSCHWSLLKSKIWFKSQSESWTYWNTQILESSKCQCPTCLFLESFFRSSELQWLQWPLPLLNSNSSTQWRGGILIVKASDLMRALGTSDVICSFMEASEQVQWTFPEWPFFLQK